MQWPLLALLSVVAIACFPNQETSTLSSSSQSENEQIREQYRRLDQVESSKQALSQSEIRQLFRSVYNNPVARLDKISFYDPKGLIGFCYGRSMAVHLQARLMGLDPNSIQKIYVVGDLKERDAEKTEWRFHVATMVKGSENQWYAIDPVLGSVMSMRQWIQRTTQIWDFWHLDHPEVSGPQAKYYLTHRDTILPDVREFAPIENETGNLIIDLSFDPTAHPGVRPRQDIGARVYQLSDEAADDLFLSALENNPSDRFDFTGLNFADGFSVHYKNYFADLMQTFQTKRSFASPFSAPSSASTTKAKESVAAESAEPTLKNISLDFNRIKSQGDDR
jgi:hypothetical protein